MDKKHDIYGANGSWADIHGGAQKHSDGSFTLFATIQDEYLFHMRYIDFSITEAMILFRKALQEHTDEYFISQTEREQW